MQKLKKIVKILKQIGNFEKKGRENGSSDLRKQGLIGCRNLRRLLKYSKNLEILKKMGVVLYLLIWSIWALKWKIDCNSETPDPIFTGRDLLDVK